MPYVANKSKIHNGRDRTECFNLLSAHTLLTKMHQWLANMKSPMEI